MQKSIHKLALIKVASPSMPKDEREAWANVAFAFSGQLSGPSGDRTTPKPAKKKTAKKKTAKKKTAKKKTAKKKGSKKPSSK